MKVQGRQVRRSRRRGAALVLVMIFGIGALMLISTMLTISDKTAQASGEVQRHRNLQAVLKAGIASAVNEINRHGSGGVNYDPDNKGVGAITGPNGEGIPITVQDARGQTVTLGFYRATVRQESPRQILTVVAAWPSFAEPAAGELDRRIFAAAELDVAITTNENTLVETTNTNPGGPFRPINIVNADASDLKIKIDNNPKINVSGKDTNPSGHLNPTSANVPGANLDVAGGKNEFVDDLVKNGSVDTFNGADPSDVSGPIANGETTVTNTESTVFNETTLSAARAAYQESVKTGVNNANASAANHSKHAGGTLKGSTKKSDPATSFPGSGAGKTVVVTNGLTIEGKVSGSGTLIIRDSLTIKGDFSWDGDIIIAGYDASDTGRPIVANSIFTMDSGGKLDVAGNVIQLGNGTVTYSDSSSAGGASKGNGIDGAFLMLANDNSVVNIELKHGSNTVVEGVLAVYSEKINYKALMGSKTTIRSLNLVTPADDNDNDNSVDILLENGSDTEWVYDNTQVLEAVTPILPILGASIVTTTTTETTTTHHRVEVLAYWERDARALFTEQEAAIDDGEDLGWHAP